MKKTEIKIPEVGESVTEAEIASWEKEQGAFVQKGEILAVIETDKASMEIPAERAGRLTVVAPAGSAAAVGAVIGFLEDAKEGGAPLAGAAPPGAPAGGETPVERPTETRAAQTIATSAKGEGGPASLTAQAAAPPARDEREPPTEQQTNPAGQAATARPAPQAPTKKELSYLFSLSPAKRHAFGERLAAGEKGFKTEDLTALKQNLQEGDHSQAELLKTLQEREPRRFEQAVSATNIQTPDGPGGRPPGFAEKAPDLLKAPSVSATKTSSESSVPAQRRERMTVLRRAVARRMVQSQQTTATLTTFNEADMSRLKEMRIKYRDQFLKKHGVKLGFMGFFVKAVCFALKKYPRLNGFIEGEDIVYNNFCHIGIAVSVEGGLVVPVIRKADEMSLPDTEKQIKHFSEKARRRAIQPQELSGGTFTISNGGVFGSLLSTPILNPPQSGVLGMHSIQNRPVAAEGRTEIRPMMYLALSYDHRIADGKEAVGFLSTVKAAVEEPARMLIDI